MGAEHEVDMGRPFEQLVPVFLGHAAGDADDEVGVDGLEALKFADLAVDLFFGALAHAAGVYEDNVSFFRPGRGGVAQVPELAGQTFAVVFVHLAAVGVYEIRFFAIVVRHVGITPVAIIS
jgi:hypothetical protein